MKLSTANVLLLATATTALSVPRRDQIPLGGDMQVARPSTTSTTTTTTPIVVPVSTPTPTSPTKSSSPSISYWDWFWTWESPKKKSAKLSASAGCFCAGGNVCCHDEGMQLQCDFGICGI
ncbi:hypothetical protein QBC46DRAFT_390104 [Diplogelasinospora grovesii]|uniref:Hydrophobin n=1 Tax=Diplogelasinospora grovesii TaxID=303347 RepID=A0AAN6S2S6_9PEZI|nr:hypothetical protein QBC46DRAFT_390104 [Diplogelasinospora grovesii]